MMLSAFTDTDIAWAIGATIAALAVLVGFGSLVVALINERRRTQPIVISHGSHDRRFSSDDKGWIVGAYATNEGAGPAFNVRFGVELGGVRYPFRMSVDDPEPGNIQRVIRPTERRPIEGPWWVVIDSLKMWSSTRKEGPNLDANTIYWARYENARGHTWETHNPSDRSSRLKIRRVRFRRLRERREQRVREQARKNGVEWEQEIIRGLQAERARHEAELGEGPYEREV